ASARRAQLVDVGRKVFAERGYEATSVEEIAARAGISKPIVYEHFGGKEGLHAVIVDREVEQSVSCITEADSNGPHHRRRGGESRRWRPAVLHWRGWAFGPCPSGRRCWRRRQRVHDGGEEG